MFQRKVDFEIPDRFRILDIFQANESIFGIEWTEINGLKTVAHGRPSKLLDSLIFPLDQDFQFAHVFLASYRFFLTSRQVFDSMVEWFNVDLYDDCTEAEEEFLKQHEKQIRSRALRNLLIWIKNYWQDFVGDRDLCSELESFLNGLGPMYFAYKQRFQQAIREQVIIYIIGRE